jgi:ketosteroid isomerase-like protein
LDAFSENASEENSTLTTTGVSPQVEIVRDYYTNIDSRDIPAALACFAGDAVYRRPGYDELVGLAAIEDFYRNTRDLGAGGHVIDSVVGSGHEVAVRGRFEGEYRDGTPLRVRFADFWLFSGEKVVERNSYLFQPAGRLI